MEDETNHRNNVINIDNHENKKGKTKFSKTVIFIILAIVVLGIIFVTMDTENTDNVENSNAKKVKLETSQGEIVIALYDDMPITTGNFERLVNDGTYDGVIFHRIIDGFMIQGGDPTGTGFGDPSIPNIQDEFTHAGGNRNSIGTIAMANAGPNTGSSQFFINLVDNSFLDDKHPAFGVVVEGLDIVDKLAKVSVDASDKPLEEVKIIKASFV